MLEFAYATGMRVTEIISLNVEDINLEEEYVICKKWSKRKNNSSRKKYVKKHYKNI